MRVEEQTSLKLLQGCHCESVPSWCVVLARCFISSEFELAG